MTLRTKLRWLRTQWTYRREVRRWGWATPAFDKGGIAYSPQRPNRLMTRVELWECVLDKYGMCVRAEQPLHHAARLHAGKGGCVYLDLPGQRP